MGFAKQEQEARCARDEAASEIAVRARVNVRCPDCGEITANFGDVADAYRLGNWLYSHHDGLVSVFRNRSEMTDAIRRAVDETGIECFCERMAAKEAS
jgi:DNA-directed RNA polymerase subunit N (RpoN/RPB10)